MLATALDDALRGRGAVDDALDGYGRAAAAARRATFDVASALGSFPPVDDFVELNRQLHAAIEEEAATLAARPPMPAPPAEFRGLCLTDHEAAAVAAGTVPSTELATGTTDRRALPELHRLLDAARHVPPPEALSL